MPTKEEINECYVIYSDERTGELDVNLLGTCIRALGYIPTEQEVQVGGVVRMRCLLPDACPTRQQPASFAETLAAPTWPLSATRHRVQSSVFPEGIPLILFPPSPSPRVPPFMSSRRPRPRMRWL